MRLVPSIQTWVTLIVLGPVLGVSILLFVLVVLTSRRVEENLGAAIVQSSTHSVRKEIYFHLRDSVRVSDLYAARVVQNTLPATAELSRWERPIFDSLAIRPNVAAVCFANPSGQATWVMRNEGGMIAGRSDGPGPGQAREHRIDANGTLSSQTLRTYQFDAPNRAWYRLALGQTEPAWTPVYTWYSDAPGVAPPVAAVGYTRSIVDAQKRLLGCVVVDVTLKSIDDLLQHLPLSKNGRVLLLDEADRVIADSSPAGESPDRPAGPHMLRAAGDADEIAIAALVEQLDRTPPTDGRVTTIEFSGKPARLTVERLQPFPGIDWRIVSVVPESAYLSESKLLQERATLIALLAIAVATVLGLVFARRLSRPIVRLAADVRRIGDGASTCESSPMIDPTGPREVRTLACAFNRMTVNLRQQVALRTAKEAAEAANRAKTAFFTRVTHELRTPLNAIIGYTEMLEEEADAQQRDGDRQVLANTLAASQQLLELINNLLDLAKIEAGKVPMQVRAFELGDLVRDVLVTATPLARRQGNQLHIDCPPGAGSMRTDFQKVRQILVNLLANSAKFTSDGQITLAVSREGSYVVFRVEDTGIGLDAADVRTLFEPFVRGSSLSQQVAQGTGLGLTICQQYARLLGGDITPVLSEELPREKRPSNKETRVSPADYRVRMEQRQAVEARVAEERADAESARPSGPSGPNGSDRSNASDGSNGSNGSDAKAAGGSGIVPGPETSPGPGHIDGHARAVGSRLQNGQGRGATFIVALPEKLGSGSESVEIDSVAGVNIMRLFPSLAASGPTASGPTASGPSASGIEESI